MGVKHPDLLRGLDVLEKKLLTWKKTLRLLVLSTPLMMAAHKGDVEDKRRHKKHGNTREHQERREVCVDYI